MIISGLITPDTATKIIPTVFKTKIYWLSLNTRPVLQNGGDCHGTALNNENGPMYTLHNLFANFAFVFRPCVRLTGAKPFPNKNLTGIFNYKNTSPVAASAAIVSGSTL